jgi:acetylornithine deacetylase/succinyl-diaminopimelate desuccinylase-like protein
MNLQAINAHIDTHSSDIIEALVEYVKQPSVSAKKEGTVKCAEMTEQMLSDTGFTTSLIAQKSGPPVVYGELKAKRGGKTLLFYDHYDVQPPEPFEEWAFNPFGGEINNGKIYGRGTSDNKGNIVSRIKAVKAFLETQGDVPVNVKFMIEGEEEIGSPNLAPVMKTHSHMFSCDATIWEFGGINYEGHPEIYLGLKGVLSVELRTKGASRDVHSANAPLIPNPAWRLIWALNSLKDENERILIERFDEKVLPPTQEELKLLADIPFEEEKLKKTLALQDFLGKKTGIDAKKALLLTPTCTVNGVQTGYTGSGSKTVLPNKAMAKLDFRLVPDQTADEACLRLNDHLKNRGFMDIEVIRHGSTDPARTPPTDTFVKTIAGAAEKTYGKSTIIYPTSAGSGPMHLFRNHLKCPIVSAGCSHPEARGHAPNENLTIEGLITGTKFMACILNDFSQQP